MGADGKENSLSSLLSNLSHPWMQHGRLQVLFVKRSTRIDTVGAQNPWTGHVAFPGGHVGNEEAALEGAQRETWEESNLNLRDTAHFMLLGRLSDRRFSRGAITMHLSAFVFLQLTDDWLPMKLQASELCDARWVDLQFFGDIMLQESPRLITSSATDQFHFDGWTCVDHPFPISSHDLFPSFQKKRQWHTEHPSAPNANACCGYFPSFLLPAPPITPTGAPELPVIGDLIFFIYFILLSSSSSADLNFNRHKWQHIFRHKWQLNSLMWRLGCRYPNIKPRSHFLSHVAVGSDIGSLCRSFRNCRDGA